MNRTTVVWTPDIDARLIELRADNPTASHSAIARMLEAVAQVGVSKDAVRNRLDRLGRTAVAPVIIDQPLARVASAPIKYLKGKSPVLGKSARELAVFVGDFQFPYEDPIAFRLFLSFLREHRPARIYLTGDIVDVFELSRFGADGGARRMSIQDEITYTHARLAEVRLAAGPDAEIYWIAGNHEERVASYIARVASPLLGLRRPGATESAISLPYLVAADDLGITWVGAQPGDLGGDYINAQISVFPGLVATHGYHARKGGGGSSILPLVERWDVSVIGGHDHRQGIAYVSRGGVAGSPVRRIAAVSTGMMCRQRLGYNAAPDWQVGFATATLFSDGGVGIDLVVIDPQDQTIVWRGNKWTATEE